MILSCNHIGISFGEKNVLSDVTFCVNDNEKCAIVGINGVGKTTLLKIITGAEQADNGEVVISKDKTIGYLKQQQDISSEKTIYEELRSAKKHIFDMEIRIRELELTMKQKDGEELSKMLDEYNNLTTLYERLGGYACESEITGVIKGLGFSNDDFNKTISTLSGGQKTRVALGKILLSSPDLIILDEPTNHLDMNSIAWLEGFLKSYKGAVLIVAHDRYFIDRISTKIVELDNGVSTVFSGNYTAYSQKKAMLRENMLKAYINQQQEIKHQEEVIAKLKQFNREKSIKRAESREKLLNKMERISKPFEINDKMRISFKPNVESGNDVLTVENLSKAFGSNHLFSDISFDIKRGERIAIIGDNGTGKTTILKIINRIIPADAGHIRLGTNVHIGYYDQEQQLLSDDNTIFEEIHDEYPYMTGTEIRNVLAAFLFTGDDVFKQIKDLSGGERGRVSLLKLMLSDSNFLILDEPTNHLDIVSKELLENALKNYKGTVLYVSHDRYFINSTATGILHLTDRHINKYIGNYDYYLEKKEAIELAYEKNSTTSPVQTTSDTSVDINRNTKADWAKQKEQKAAARKLQRELEHTEKLIEETEQRISELDEELIKPENSCNTGLLMELTTERNALEEQLLELMENWESLSLSTDEL
ncbi:MAG: ATP-binding cassette domain-containing protein [Lachnospiraceae bacterium]|nr:ATP-binding cassette domain-containing protein [Lachnospiraceae bacterium]